MKIEVNGTCLNYTEAGTGCPLILLHGNGEDHHIFDELIDKLKNDFTVYAIDSRNHGESSMTDDHRYETMAEDIFQFIEKKELKNVSILGFSDGAILGLLLAINCEMLFHRMVLLGVNLKPTDFKDEMYQYMVDEYKKTGDPLMKMMLNQPNIELSDLKNISAKTLVVVAENDLFKEELYDDIVAVMPNASLKVIEGHDHGSYIVNEDILYSDLKDFLL